MSIALSAYSRTFSLVFIDISCGTERVVLFKYFSLYLNKNKEIHIKFVRSRQPGVISLMSYSLLRFVKINTELLRGVFTTQRFDTPV